MNGVDETGPLEEVSDTESETDEHIEESRSASNSSANLPRPVSEDLPEVDSTLSVLVTSTDIAMNSDELSAKDSKTLVDVDQENVRHVAGDDVATVTSQLEDLIDRALGLGSATITGKNYKYETSRIDIEEDGHEEKKTGVRDRPYISKAERRRLKKGQKNDIEANAEQEEEKSEENYSFSNQLETKVHDAKLGFAKKSYPSVQFETKAHDAKPGSGKISRGQKGKLKKMKEKYADQDEEERNIRMALLAVSTMTCTILC